MSVGGRMMVPKDVHSLNPRTCMGVTFHGEGDLADAIKAQILRWGEALGASLWVQWNHKAPYKRVAGVSETEM